MTSRGRAAAAAASCSLLTLALGVPLLGLIGLGHDEVFHAVVTVPLLGESFAKPVSFYEYMPLMRDSYQGSFKIFLLYLPFKLFGSGAVPLRATVLLVAALTPAFAFLLVRRLYGTRLAAAIAVLVAADPALVLSCFEAAPATLMLAEKLLGLLLLAEWWEGKPRRRYLAGAGWAFGMALWDKSHFLWVLAALPVCALLLPWRKLRARADARGLAAGLAGFALGAAPYLLHNAIHPLASINNPANGGWPLAQHLTQLPRWVAARWAILVNTLSGTGQYGACGATPPLQARWALWTTLGASGAAAAFVARRRRRLEELRQGAFWYALAASIFAAACLSPVPVKWHHLYAVYPLPHLGLAALLAAAFRADRALERRSGMWLLVCAAVLLCELSVLAEFRSVSSRTGGGLQFARGWEEVAAWMRQEHLREPDAIFFVDDGIENRATVYTGGGVPMRSLPATFEDAGLNAGQADVAFELLKYPGSIVLADLPLEGEVTRYSARSALEMMRVGLEPIRTFSFWDGRPMAAAYRLRSPMMEAFQDAATLAKAGRRDAARRRAREAVALWKKAKAPMERLRRQRARQGLETVAPALDLRFFLSDLLASLPRPARYALVKDVAAAGVERAEADDLWLQIDRTAVPDPAGLARTGVAAGKRSEAAAPAQDPLAALLLQANLAIESRRPSDALAALADVRRRARAAAPLRRAAELYQKLGRPEDALAVVSELASRPGADAEVWTEKAWLSLGLGRREAAAAALAEAEGRGPTRADRLRAARMRQQLEQYDQAIADLEPLANADPRDAEALSDLGLNDYLAGRRERAVAELVRAVAADPDRPEALLSLGAIYAGEKRFPEAAAAYRKAAAARATPRNRPLREAALKELRALSRAGTK